MVEPEADVDRPLELAVNAALEKLGKDDWKAVHLRFYEGLSLADVGQAFGVSEDTAQKRVSRALDRMRRTLRSTGAALSIVGVEELLRTEAARAASEHLAQVVLANGPVTVIPAAIGSAHIHQLAKGILKTMLIKNVAVASAIVVMGVSAVVVAPVIGGQLRGVGGSGGGKSAVSQKQLPLNERIANKQAYLAKVHEYNKQWTQIYGTLSHYTNSQVVYKEIKATPTSIKIHAHAKSMKAVKAYLAEMNLEPDLSSVSIDKLPGYPEPEIKKYYLDGKLIDVRTNRGGRPKGLPVNQPTPFKSLAGKPGIGRVRTVSHILRRQLRAANSKAEREQIMRAANKRIKVTVIPTGFMMTIDAKLKQPLPLQTDPPTR